MRVDHAAIDAAGDRDSGFVGHDVEQRLIGVDLGAWLDVPGDDFSFDDAFAQVRQLEYDGLHGGGLSVEGGGLSVGYSVLSTRILNSQSWPAIRPRWFFAPFA